MSARGHSGRAREIGTKPVGLISKTRILIREIGTQRLAKLAKNVAAEASNFLMGRTFLDIDMQRAADLLGMDRRTAEMFRDLKRGRFMALGPALARRPVAVR